MSEAHNTAGKPLNPLPITHTYYGKLSVGNPNF